MYNLYQQLHFQASWGHGNILRKIVLKTIIPQGPLWVHLHFISLCAHRHVPSMSMLPASPRSTLHPLLDKDGHTQATVKTYVILFRALCPWIFLPSRPRVWTTVWNTPTSCCTYFQSSKMMLFSLTCPSLHESTEMQSQQGVTRDRVREFLEVE